MLNKWTFSQLCEFSCRNFAELRLYSVVLSIQYSLSVGLVKWITHVVDNTRCQV